jgi:hypothetical protein
VNRRHPAIHTLAALSIVAGLQMPAHGYLKLGVTTASGQRTELRWTNTPVRYWTTNTGVPGVSAPAFQAAVARAFTTWEAVPTSTIAFQFAGFTDAPPFVEDNMSTLGFLDLPELERVLGATDFLVDNRTGEILESDIFFNAAFPWSVAPSGEPGRFDVESIAVHEIGHMIGLGHSALGETTLAGTGRRVTAAEAVMFPIAFAAGNVEDRSLRADDIAGVSDLYPTAAFTSGTGTIGGRVTKNGRGIFGAHVVAFNPATRKLVASFTLDQNGVFAIAGLDPGAHVVRVEPLDDADVDSFFSAASATDIDFRVAFFDRLVGVPAGGGALGITVAVSPK